MKISVELTLSPLQDDFEAPVIEFIKKMRNSGLTILENPLSTQVFRDYNRVMEILQTEIKKSFESLDHVVLTMKMVKSDRSEYEPHF